MAAAFQWGEDNGTATGWPAKGYLRTLGVNQGQWKNIDSATASYTMYPITTGQSSYSKYQFGYFSGMFNRIGNGKWTHTNGTLGTGLQVRGEVTSSYVTPSTTPQAWAVDMTLPVDVSTGQQVLFSPAGPEGSSAVGALTLAGYTQYLVSQLQTTTAAVSGDIASLTFALQYDEN